MTKNQVFKYICLLASPHLLLRADEHVGDKVLLPRKLVDEPDLPLGGLGGSAVDVGDVELKSRVAEKELRVSYWKRELRVFGILSPSPCCSCG